MGPRGFARTATKEDCIEVQLSASDITSCYRRAKHGTPPPLPGAGGHGSGATAECAMKYLWPKL